MRSSAGNTLFVLFEKDKSCPMHPTKLLTYHCEREGKLICEECAIGKHANYDPIKIDDTLLEDEK